MVVGETERLVIRHFGLEDAAYILRQLNEASFIRFIADRHVRSLRDAETHLRDGPMASYQRMGFGLNLVLLREGHVPIGMCGLVNRKELAHPDLGFAFLPEAWGKGYATEACEAVLADAMGRQGVDRVLGVTLPSNVASNRLLKQLGFGYSGLIELYGAENHLYTYSHISGSQE